MLFSPPFRTIILPTVLFALQGCSLRGTVEGAGKLAGGAMHGMLHPGTLLPHRKTAPPPPPKAGILREVGTIRSVSEDGGYAIVELAPGTTLTTGSPLIVAGADGGTVRLKAGEISYPCCVADIEEGHPAPGDTVKR
jgi:hypothetical protein